MKKIFIFLSIVTAVTATAQQKDSILNKNAVDSTGIYTKVEKEAEFPGGEEKWNEYIRKTIETNVDKIMKNKPSIGTCEVQFIVDKDGSIRNVEALSMQKSFLAKIFIEAVKKGPKWLPATKDGKPVNAWRRQKVTFRAPDYFNMESPHSTT